MPRPTDSTQRYIPGLDGIRAIAVLCVIAYHLNVGWAQGGLLGVGVFFTLSGYLITDLLLAHWDRYGTLGLRRFWARRARRLLPALFVMLIVVSVWVAAFDTSQLAQSRREVVSAALYFANWSTIAVHGSYFARFAAPLPLDHLWSLSIEEQFYFVWPWLLWLLLYLVTSRRQLVLVTLAAALGSAVLMGLIYAGGTDPTRIYEGTDTRAFGLLIGAALAMVRPTVIPRLSVRPSAGWSSALLDIAGAAGLLCIFALVWRTSSLSAFLYPIGLILLSVATAVVIAAVVNPSSSLGQILGCRPLRWIGVRSYGIYLWHWPLIVLWGRQHVGVSWPSAALQVTATMVIASLSWHYVEDPIRRGALGRLRRRSRSHADVVRARRRALAVSTGLVAVGSLFVADLAGALPGVSKGHTGPEMISSLPPSLARLPGSGGLATPGFAKKASPHPTRTSCGSVVYIGDSTSEGEISTNYIPDPRKRLRAQLAKVGVKTQYTEVSGARSIVERYKSFPNAASVAQAHISEGFHGCWILALGTNDVANETFSRVGTASRIDRMMKIIGRRPVLWVDTVTLLSGGRYSEAGMTQWNRQLLSACRRYPNLRIYDWAAHARRKWFIPDGIHYYSPGYVARAHDIAKGLVDAFPQHQARSANCLLA